MKKNSSVETSAGTKGLWYGLVGVVSFSLSLPATRLAVADLDPVVVGLGRALVAALLAAGLLLVTRTPRPSRSQLRGLLLVALGVVVGFPLLSAWAMQRVPAAHGAIVIGVLPLATALASVMRAGERPSGRFWVLSLMGAAVVVGYVLADGGGQLQAADAWLLGAVAAAALGYAEGGRLARELGGWQVICWALVLAAPVLVFPVAQAVRAHGLHAGPMAWAGFAYVSMVSMFLGFFAWYHGLALGGVARVGQLQLLQPFLTILASAALLGETISGRTLLAAGLVILIVAMGRRAAVSPVAQSVLAKAK
ncbi:DMT family transporter [Hymenobacter terrenus]|uniref:DMT family transporter n=1 Tax=Hymenobacter terrenus TaxID=1629124 RepID=UPI0006197CFA|nr:DMT family transporter [Hymenobacter terrenus]